jgi:hypothetical protein
MFSQIQLLMYREKAIIFLLLFFVFIGLPSFSQKKTSHSLVKEFIELPIDYRKFEGVTINGQLQGDCSMTLKQEDGKTHCYLNYSIDNPFSGTQKAKEKFAVSQLERVKITPNANSPYISYALSGQIEGITAQVGNESPFYNSSEGSIDFYLDSVNLSIVYFAKTGPKFNGSKKLSVFQYIVCKEFFKNQKLSQEEIRAAYSKNQNLLLTSTDTSFVELGYNQYKFYINEKLIFSNQKKVYDYEGKDYSVNCDLSSILSFDLITAPEKVVYEIDLEEDWQGVQNRAPEWASDFDNSPAYNLSVLFDSPKLNQYVNPSATSGQYNFTADLHLESSNLDCENCKFNRLSKNHMFEAIFKDPEFSKQIKIGLKNSAFKIQSLPVYERYRNLNDRSKWVDEPIEIYIEFYSGDKPLIYELIKDNPELESMVQQGYTYYNSGDFVQSRNTFEEAYKIRPLNYLLSLMDSCSNKVYQINYAEGNNLFSSANYGLAKTKYTEAIKYLKSAFPSRNTDARITGELSKLIIECDFIPALNLAKQFMEKRNYTEALKEYEIAIALKPNEEIVKEQIDLIKKTINFLDLRNTEIYPYSKFNSSDFANLKSSIVKGVNDNIAKSSSGNLQCRFVVAFDTSGRSNSRIENYASTINSNVFQNILNETNLRPIEFFGYYANAKDEISLSGNWSSVNSTLRFKSGVLVAAKNTSNTYANIVIDLANKYHINQGTFHSSIKTIELNKQFHSEMELVRYKPLGPSLALYSVVVPCLGSYKMVSVDKFISRFKVFGTALGLTGLLHVYSSVTYDEYLAEADPTQRESLYKTANITHKLALVSFGVMGAVYLYDIIDVFHKGMKNKRNSIPLTNILKVGPIKIKTDPIKSL